jgi:hypothetical protein
MRSARRGSAPPLARHPSEPEATKYSYEAVLTFVGDLNDVLFVCPAGDVARVSPTSRRKGL